MDVMLLEGVAGPGNSPFGTSPGEVWESLQEEREEVNRELLSEGRLSQCNAGRLLESEASEEYTRAIRWQNRSQLQARLKDITDAQDRLIEGRHGRCAECAQEIESKRLKAEPAAALCIGCERSVAEERSLEKLFGTGSVH